MCLLCVEMQKGKMTAAEIARAYTELSDVDTTDHWVEVLNTINTSPQAIDVMVELAKRWEKGPIP